MHKRSKRVLTGIGMLVVVLGVVYTVALVRSMSKLRRAYAALEKDGRPMNAADAIPPEIPDAQNAALLYQRAVATLKELPAPKKDLLEYTSKLCFTFLADDLDPNELAEFEELMGREEVASALSLLEEAMGRPGCRFDRDYEGGMFEKPFEPHDLRRLAGIARARAYRGALAGDGASAWEVVRSQFKIADALAADPTLDSQTQRLGLIRDCCYTMQKLCSVAPLTADGCGQTLDLLKEVDSVGPLVRATDADRLLRGEWFFNQSNDQLYNTLRKGELGIGGEDTPEVFFRLEFCLLTFRPSFVAAHAAYLRTMYKGAEMLESPYVPRDVGVRKEFRDAPGRHFLAHRLAPWTDFLKEVHCEMAARVHMTRAGLGLLQYRKEHGAFPQTLDDVKLEKLVDPFVQEPLRYRAEQGGFIVYSVGDDLHDNGGVPRERWDSNNPRYKTPEYDLLWRFDDAQGSTTENI